MNRRPHQSRDRKGSLSVAILSAMLTISGSLHPVHAQTVPPATTMTVNAPDSPSASLPSENQRILHWRQAFFWGIILVFVFFIAALVIIRFSLRYRAYLFREKPPPTPSEDVWQMHRLPEDEDSKP